MSALLRKEPSVRGGLLSAFRFPPRDPRLDLVRARLGVVGVACEEAVEEPLGDAALGRLVVLPLDEHHAGAVLRRRCEAGAGSSNCNPPGRPRKERWAIPAHRSGRRRPDKWA